MFNKYSRPYVIYKKVLNGLLNILTRLILPLRNLNKPISVAYPNILIISHKDKQCGVYQYGVNISEALRKSKKYRFVYCECENKLALDLAIEIHDPVAIIYNYYPDTMSWLNSWVTHSYDTIPQLGILHENTQKKADMTTNQLFDYTLCPDPTLIDRNPVVFKTLRLIHDYTNTKPLPDTVTIGSFGFGSNDKGFERLVDMVQQEFDVAIINFLMPFNDIIDKEGTRFTLATAEQCRKAVYKPGITLNISHKFLTKPELLDFLASNTANAFFYDVKKEHGISSTIEYALAVHRPLVINKCGMFRHVFNAEPSICIENSTIKEIIANGTAPLQPFYGAWTEEKFIQRYEQIIDEVLK